MVSLAYASTGTEEICFCTINKYPNGTSTNTMHNKLRDIGRKIKESKGYINKEPFQSIECLF